MKLVRLLGHDAVYPSLCACCVARPTALLEVRTRKAEIVGLAAGLVDLAGVPLARALADRPGLQVPYCGRCRGHVQWKRSGGWLGVALHVPVNAFFGFLAGMVLALLAGAAGLSGDVDRPSWFIVGACVTVGVALAFRTMRWRPEVPFGRHHACEGEALEIARISSSELVVRCHNDDFAAKLIETNRGASEASAP